MPTTQITPDPYSSSGSAAPTTAAGTFLKMRVRIEVDHSVRGARRTNSAHSSRVIRFVWQAYEMRAIVFRKQVEHLKAPRYYWTFVAGDVILPHQFRSHELPQAAQFLLECHRRLSASVAEPSFFSAIPLLRDESVS